jgi:hypothetical protein
MKAALICPRPVDGLVKLARWNLEQLAVNHALIHTKTYPMPANNQLIVWQKR